MPAPSFHRHVYTIRPHGRIRVENRLRIDPGLADPPRLGVTVTLADAFEGLAWFGRGRLENYVDRNRAAWIGQFEGAVRD